MKTKILLFASLLLIAAGCNKEDMDIDQLPPITQEGLNTFGCLINGKVHVPKNGKSSGLFTGGSGARGFTIQFGPSFSSEIGGGFIGIRATNRLLSQRPFVYLYLPEVVTESNFSIGSSNNQVGLDSPPHPHVFYRINDDNDNVTAYLSLPELGKINISKFDLANTIISGTFELKALNQEDYFDTLFVTEGRFDINWIKLFNN